MKAAPSYPKSGKWLPRPEAHTRPAPGAPGSPQLGKTSHLSFLSFNPHVLSGEER